MPSFFDGGSAHQVLVSWHEHELPKEELVRRLWDLCRNAMYSAAVEEGLDDLRILLRSMA